MEQDIPRPKKSPRVSLIMVKSLSATVVGQESPQKEKIPDKPTDEEEKKGKEIDPTNLTPDGLMQYYAKLGDVEAMRKAYEEGAKVNVPDHGPGNQEGSTDINYPITGDYPLHMAAGAGHKAAVNELLNLEADIEAKNRIGSTPLHRAVSHDQLEIVTRLIDEGASINATNKIGNTPLHCAAFIGSVDMVKLLVERKATSHILLGNRFGASPLMIAAQNSGGVLKYFLSLQSSFKEAKRLMQNGTNTNPSPRGSVKENNPSPRGSIKEKQPTQKQDDTEQEEKQLKLQQIRFSIKKPEDTEEIASPSYLDPSQRMLSAPSIVDPPSTNTKESDIELSTLPQPSVRIDIDL